MRRGSAHVRKRCLYFYRCTQPHGHCQTMTVGDLSVPSADFLRIFLQITLQQLQERLKSATCIDDIRCLDFYRLIIWSFIFDPNDLPLGTQKLFNPTSKVNLAAIGPQPLIQQSQKIRTTSFLIETSAHFHRWTKHWYWISPSWVLLSFSNHGTEQRKGLGDFLIKCSCQIRISIIFARFHNC